MVIEFKNDQKIQEIDDYISKKAEELYQKVLSDSRNLEDLNTAIWKMGKPIKDGTDVEKMIHYTIYKRFSEKMHSLLKEIQFESFQKVLPPKR